MEPTAILLINAVILLLLTVILPAVSSLVGGWRALSARFRTTRPTPMGASWFVSARFGSMPYLGSMAIAPLVEGLYLARLPLFRWLHPPLLIPWSELRGFGDSSNSTAPVLLRVEAPRVSLVVPARFVLVHDDGRVGVRGRPAVFGPGWVMGWGGSLLFLALILAVQVLLGIVPPRDSVIARTEVIGGRNFDLVWSSSAEDDYSLWLDFAITYDGPAWTVRSMVFPVVNGAGSKPNSLVFNPNTDIADSDAELGAYLEETETETQYGIKGRIRLATISSTGVADEMAFTGKISVDQNVDVEYMHLEVVDD